MFLYCFPPCLPWMRRLETAWWLTPTCGDSFLSYQCSHLTIAIVLRKNWTPYIMRLLYLIYLACFSYLFLLLIKTPLLKIQISFTQWNKNTKKEEKKERNMSQRTRIFTNLIFWHSIIKMAVMTVASSMWGGLKLQISSNLFWKFGVEW